MRALSSIILITLLLCGASVARAQYGQQGAQNPPGGNPKLQTLQGLASLAMAKEGITDGLQQAGQQVVGKVKDTAQNVWDNTQNVWDTTQNVAQNVHGCNQKVVGTVVDGIQAVPQDVASNLANARTGFVNTARQVGSIAQSTGEFIGSVVPDLPPVSQMLNPHAWKETYQTYGDQLDTTYATLADTAEAIGQGIASKYCSEAAFSAGTKKPAKFVGHGFTIAFDTGFCFFDSEAFYANKTKHLNSSEPSITFIKTPANITSKYHAAPKFYGKSCSLSKTFGESITKVLYVFDGTSNPDLSAISSKITDELHNIIGASQTGSSAIAGQMQNFLSSIAPKLRSFKGKLGGLGSMFGNKVPAESSVGVSGARGGAGASASAAQGGGAMPSSYGHLQQAAESYLHKMPQDAGAGGYGVASS